MKHDDIEEAFARVLHSGPNFDARLHDCGWLAVRETRASYDPGERHAELAVVELDPDDPTKFKSYSKVCTVDHERAGFGQEGMRTQVNWSAWGSQDLETAHRVAEALLVAEELGRAYADGFTFVTQFIARHSAMVE